MRYRIVQLEPELFVVERWQRIYLFFHGWRRVTFYRPSGAYLSTLDEAKRAIHVLRARANFVPRVVG